MPSFNISTYTANLPYQFRQTAQGGSVFVKNPVVAYRLTSTTFTEITHINYPSRHTYGCSSLVHAPGTSTATFTANTSTSLATGDSVAVWGADQGAYNVTTTITVLHLSSFTYSVTSSPASPATSTANIFARGGKTTVPGVVYLDDYIFVQDIEGPIQNSSTGDMTRWGALDFITPEKEPSNPVAIAKSLNYVVSFKQWDTEFFYDSGISTGSPLAVVNEAYLKLGCASPHSIVEFDGGIIFMSKRDQLQRSREIQVLSGLTPKKISSPEAERLLNADDLTTNYACYLATAGHQLYTLTLKSISTTVVYDFNNGLWYEWDFLTAQTTTAVASLTAAANVATATVSSHGFNDGDPIVVGGATQGAYNGTFNITRIDANSYSYVMSSFPNSPATGTVTTHGYTASYFPAVAYATHENADLVLHESTGIIYSLDPDNFTDQTAPINLHLRLSQWDGGNNKLKMISRLRLIGDRVAASSYIRYSDNDSSTYSNYRSLDMSRESAQLSRLGSTRRRVYEVRHTASTYFRAEALEQDEKQGT